MIHNEIARIKPIDSLRGLAALGIAFFWHYGHFGSESFPFKFGEWIRLNGWILVDLFFILSGFIFMHVYKNQIITKSISFKKYLVNRFSRLYPLHLLTLVLVAVLQGIYKSINGNFFIYEFNDAYYFILNVLFLHAGMFENGSSFNGPSWSIAIEMLGYLIFFVVLFKYGKSKPIYIALFILIVLVGMTIQKQDLNFVLFNKLSSRLFISFFIGALLYDINEFIGKKTYRNTVTLFVAIVLIVYLVLTDRIGYSITGNHNTYNLFVFPSIIYLLLNVKILYAIFSARILTFIGDISFSLYLLHFPVQLVIKILVSKFVINVDYSSLTFYFIYVFSALALASLSYFYFEKTAMNKIRNFKTSD